MTITELERLMLQRWSYLSATAFLIFLFCSFPREDSKLGSSQVNIPAFLLPRLFLRMVRFEWKAVPSAIVGGNIQSGFKQRFVGVR